MNRVGVSRILNRGKRVETIQALGDKLARESEQNVALMVSDFCDSFKRFINKYSSQIGKSPQIHNAIVSICHTLDMEVDDYGVEQNYNRVVERVVIICTKLKRLNGGLLDIERCKQLIKPKYPNITNDDIIRAVKELSILGGIELVTIGHRLVISTNCHINEDENQCLALINNNYKSCNGVKIINVMERLKWNFDRARACIILLVSKGVLWIDRHIPGKSFDISWHLKSNGNLDFYDLDSVKNFTFYAIF